jgi:hypothetical protein
LAVFKTAAFDLSATPPAGLSVPTVAAFCLGRPPAARAGRRGPARTQRGWSLDAASAILAAMNTLLIGCSDGRVAARQAALLNDVGHPDANRLIVPGGPLPLTRTGSERRVALDCIREIVEVHDVRTIYVVAHQECAAYERALGGLGFDQQELLERDLRRVKALLETNFPGVDVRCYVIPWREDGEGAAYGPAAPVD